MSVFVLMGLPGQMKKVIDYLELNGLDSNLIQSNLDAAITSRASASDYTSARAGLLDNLNSLDVSVSSTRAVILKSARFTSDGVWSVPAGILGKQIFLSGVGGGGAGLGNASGGGGGGAAMGCRGLPFIIPEGVNSFQITIGAGGTGNGGQGGSTLFGNYIRLLGGNRPHARHGARTANHEATWPDISTNIRGGSDGFYYSGASGGLATESGGDVGETYFLGGSGHSFSSGAGGGGASCFANGGDGSDTGSPGTLGSGGGGAYQNSSGAAGGNGFLEVLWHEKI